MEPRWRIGSGEFSFAIVWVHVLLEHALSTWQMHAWGKPHMGMLAEFWENRVNAEGVRVRCKKNCTFTAYYFQ